MLRMHYVVSAAAISSGYIAIRRLIVVTGVKSEDVTRETRLTPGS